MARISAVAVVLLVAAFSGRSASAQHGRSTAPGTYVSGSKRPGPPASSSASHRVRIRVLPRVHVATAGVREIETDNGTTRVQAIRLYGNLRGLKVTSGFGDGSFAITRVEAESVTRFASLVPLFDDDAKASGQGTLFLVPVDEPGASAAARPGDAASGRAESRGADSGDAVPGSVAPGGAVPGSAAPGGAVARTVVLTVTD